MSVLLFYGADRFFLKFHKLSPTEIDCFPAEFLLFAPSLAKQIPPAHFPTPSVRSKNVRLGSKGCRAAGINISELCESLLSGSQPC